MRAVVGPSIVPDRQVSADLTCRPLLKWAGGKGQLLGAILPKVPKIYGRIIEPFFGGGALFFAVRPENGIIADSHPELVNLYRSVASDADGVLAQLRHYENTEDVFYAVRALDVAKLSNVGAAARTIFLNRTCFNGLYRVNKSGNSMCLLDGTRTSKL